MPDQATAAAVETRNTTLAAVERFNEAFNRQDLDATMAVMTADCVFEDTNPAPDGTRYEGRDAVRAAFEKFFNSSPRAEFQVEELFTVGDRCIVRWHYSWASDGGQLGHVRGVDIFQVRDNLIVSKLSYVKG